MPRVNYVLCCWSGPRRAVDPRVEVDPAYYLRRHLDALQSVAHELSQITVVVPKNESEPLVYRQALEAMPAKIRGAPVVLMERPNIGMSYGSLSDCYARYRTEFDFYFFMEDDYVFVQQNFDQIHLQVMAEHPDCGYLCGMAWETNPPMAPRFPLHAGVANGLMRASALEAVFAKEGHLPHAADGGYRSNEHRGQIGQSQAILAAGFKLRDWAGRFRVRFREADFSVREFHEDQEAVMMEPL